VPQFTLPYAVDNGWFAERAAAAAQTREELRAELGLAPGRKVILFAAKLIERKRCVDLIQAYAQAFTSGAKAPSPGSAHIAGLKPGAPTNQAQSTPDQEERHPYLLIVGDGAEAERLKQRAAEIDADGIRFAGFRSQQEMPRFYDLCDVFCLPSVHEPWGLAINEVMACGKPVIVSDEVGCQPDLVHDGETGLVFPAKNVEALAECLRRVAEDPKLAAQLTSAGRQQIAGWSFDADIAGLWAAIRGLGVAGR
jgi:glycosyltransferase involved in cell wall biosynthesis